MSCGVFRELSLNKKKVAIRNNLHKAAVQYCILKRQEELSSTSICRVDSFQKEKVVSLKKNVIAKSNFIWHKAVENNVVALRPHTLVA